MKIKKNLLSRMFQQGVTEHVTGPVSSPGRKLHKSVAAHVELQKPAAQAYQESRRTYRAGKVFQVEQPQAPISHLLLNLSERTESMQKLAASRAKGSALTDDMLMAAEKEFNLLQAAVARSDELTIGELLNVRKAQQAAQEVLQKFKSRPAAPQKAEPPSPTVKEKQAEIWAGRAAQLQDPSLSGIGVRQFGAINIKDVPERGVKHTRVPAAIEIAFAAPTPAAPTKTMPVQSLSPVKKNLPPVDSHMTQLASGLFYMGSTIESVHAPAGMPSAFAKAKELSDAFIKAKQQAFMLRDTFTKAASELSSAQERKENLSEEAREHIEATLKEEGKWEEFKETSRATMQRLRTAKSTLKNKLTVATQEQMRLAKELEKYTQKTLKSAYTVVLSGGKQATLRPNELASMVDVRRKQADEQQLMSKWQQGIRAVRPQDERAAQLGESSQMSPQAKLRPSNKTAPLNIPKRIDVPFSPVETLLRNQKEDKKKTILQRRGERLAWQAHKATQEALEAADRARKIPQHREAARLLDIAVTLHADSAKAAAESVRKAGERRSKPTVSPAMAELLAKREHHRQQAGVRMIGPRKGVFIKHKKSKQYVKR